MSTSGSIPAPQAGWYADPAGTGRLRWWDGSIWTDQYSTPPPQGAYGGAYAPGPYGQSPYGQSPYGTSPYGGSPYGQAPYPAGQNGYVVPVFRRPFIARDAEVYNPLIWAITLLPLLPLVLLLFWNPELRYIYLGRQSTRTLDPWSLFTPSYFFLLLSGFVTYATAIVLAYFDSERLKRAGVVRPFHWAWAFLNSGVYVIGRSVIVSKVARGRGLVPIWVMIGVFILSIVVSNIKMAAMMSPVVGTIPA
ncbi:DUF2510 domain-containing protein [Pseudarthrobacter sulfonivorans]|uniref:DUF2510 domain-containing protein n=1 Tax=Pseudarthrobacter sulfonivorans TaxID=121292 RepID=UPI002102F5B0|nr:DUF2510 domain-containing protein [Pseudarthrobacter sulfonivorans]